jgi:hypothetical protein
MSFTSPFSTPAWMAAPMATTSSGLTPLCGSLPAVRSFTSRWMAGMRVAPPTSTTSSICCGVTPASFSAAMNGPRQRSVRSAVSASNRARVSVVSRCRGPVWSAVMKGRLIVVSSREESSILARSAASVRRWSAWRSAFRSIPFSFLNSSASQSTIRRS